MGGVLFYLFYLSVGLPFSDTKNERKLLSHNKPYSFKVFEMLLIYRCVFSNVLPPQMPETLLLLHPYSLYLSVCLCLCLSICVSVCLSVCVSLYAFVMPVLFVLYTTPLSDIIANHCVNHQLFADATQLKKSAPLSEVTNLTKELNACTDDIKTWMTENQLKLNDDKTEALLFPFSSSLKPSITLGSQNIPFSDSAGNLGFILDSKLSMKKEVIKFCQTVYFELKLMS